MKIKELSKVAAECSIPAYCVKIVGSRHILIGGGGGSAKTGVLNQLQLYLLSYGSEFDTTRDRYAPSFTQLIAQLNCSMDTAEFANMNMDCIAMNTELERGHYLFAVGQDQFCTIYKTTGFSISQETGSNGLALDLQTLLRIETNNGAACDDSYQKCVRLFHPKDNNIKMVTTGTDCHVRLWSIADLIEMSAKTKNGENATIPEKLNDAIPELVISLGKSAVEEIDVSSCGQLLATVLPQSTTLWDIRQNGAKILDLPTENGQQCEAVSKKFKIRTLRFTGLDKTGKLVIFVTAHNQRVRSSKEISHLVLWSFVRGTTDCRLIQTKIACKESISCLEISDCDKFIAIGTMGGSIAIFDTQTLQSLLFLPQTHSSFVTALAFLPQKTYDIKDLGRIREKENPPGRYFLPGICANSRAALVSISVDKRIMVHQLPFPAPPLSFTGSLLQICLLIAIPYALFWQQSPIIAIGYALLWIISFFYSR